MNAMEPGFDIDIVRRGGTHTLVVRGELDIATAPLLRERLASTLATDAANVVVDLDHVDFIDSSGLHVLIEFCNQHENRLRLTKGSAQVRRLFELTGVFRHLPFK